ncbi:MAG: hypothetical protein AAGF12_38065, partial [Myxococcota bacterium]
MAKRPYPIEIDAERWRRLGTRPSRIDTPGPGQESVWDYPRPPRVEDVGPRVRVVHEGTVLAESDGALRVLETASAP